ncbi:MAG: PAS domain S-box protein [Sphingomonadaceae bacterium]|nr:PAS domain S-box protein [Sphingomonadaceae bacterium]
MVKREPHVGPPDRAQLHQIIADMTDGVVQLEADGRIVWANVSALAMHGVDRVEALGATATQYQKRFKLALRDGRQLSARDYPMARLCRGNGFDDLVVNVCRMGKPEPDWVHRYRGIVLRDTAGEINCLVLVIDDATDAFEAEERFESMFNANPAPALIVRLVDLRFVRVNEGFLELSGYSEDQIIGRTMYDIDILEGAEKKDKAKSLFKEGATVPQMEAELPVPAGGTKLILLAGHPAELANEPCMIFTFADLEPRRRAEEALRQSEERFSTAFRLAPVPMMLSSLDGHRILNVNHAFLTVTGWSIEAVIGRRPADIELWESSAARREIDRKVAESGSFRSYELKLKTRDGKLVTCLVSAETVTINGQYCLLSAFQDITDRKRTELDLIAAIEGAMRDTSWLSQKIMDRLAALRDPSPKLGSGTPPVDLTTREREVLALITQGKSDSAIAETLSLKRNTVRNHVARLYGKMGAHNRAEAIIWARDRGHHIGAHEPQ